MEMDKNSSAAPVGEGNITFVFYAPWEKFDERPCNGLKLVDFLIHNKDCLYFIEVKDYEHPKTPAGQRTMNYKMLNDPAAALPLEIGMKLKDSLLRYYARSGKFTAEVKFLFIINSVELKSRERIKLAERVAGYVPNGLNSDKYPSFSKISFDMPLIDGIKEKYGFECFVKES
jgi:hypothetical protein